jgi:hypothetical protein
VVLSITGVAVDAKQMLVTSGLISSWICCRGHQDASLSKRVTTFGWVDLRQHGRQFGVAVLVMRAAPDDGSLGAWKEF